MISERDEPEKISRNRADSRQRSIALGEQIVTSNASQPEHMRALNNTQTYHLRNKEMGLSEAGKPPLTEDRGPGAQSALARQDTRRSNKSNKVRSITIQ